MVEFCFSTPKYHADSHAVAKIQRGRGGRESIPTIYIVYNTGLPYIHGCNKFLLDLENVLKISYRNDVS
jgi:hypothetical protein